MDKNIYVDIDLCVGCGACAIACMDQNDTEPDMGQPALRRIHRTEVGHNPHAEIHYLSIACMHCEDSPCVIGCPTGAIAKNDQTKAVIVKKELCIGCHSCALACPFGVPRYDSDDKMTKCELCSERVEYGLEPACVRVCPFSALKFESANKMQEQKEAKYSEQIVKAGHKPAM